MVDRPIVRVTDETVRGEELPADSVEVVTTDPDAGVIETLLRAGQQAQGDEADG